MRSLGFAALTVVALAATAQAADVRFLGGHELPPAARLALQELKEVLIAHGDQVVPIRTAGDDVPLIAVGLRDGVKFESPEKRKLLERPESLSVSWTEDGRSLAILGADERGLTYALRDVARGIAVTPKNEPWKKGVTATPNGVEAPFLRVRNVSVHLFNADCEREWFFSEDFWRFYFQRLSLSRFNRCTLTFCDQTNYLCPPYAYLVDMPEYPDVKIADCTAEQRRANAAMVRRIAELADEYAIDFDLGIWMQAPVEKWAAPVMVTGLPTGMEHAKYCALGLQRVLAACPSIDGIQLRMNAEAGVPEDEQTAFYKPMFQAMAAVQANRDAAKPYRLELRYKGLTQETIDAAVAEKLDVTVSTKFWAEHFGLPYHPTVVDSHYAKDRYSFGTMLHKPRNYRVTYQLWTVGSQRVTLWGDPEYASRFAKSCTLGDGEGFEVFAPLTNKGYGNKPGAWQVIKNPDYRVGRWEQERYWAFYLAFGRMGYDPQAKLEFWDREFRHRFGKHALTAEYSYRSASRVLPLITTALLPSASEWYWWPEMDTGGNLNEYARIPPSDPGRFAAIQAWKKTPKWRWEEWDTSPNYIDDQSNGASAMANRTDVLTISDDLLKRSFELQVIAGTWEFATRDRDPSPETRSTQVDLQVLGQVAWFHGLKLRAAAQYAATSGDELRRAAAVVFYYDLALEAWQTIITLTKDVYHDDLVFGITPDMPRSKFGHHHSGHWRDRFAEIEADREDAAVRLQKIRKSRSDYEAIRDEVRKQHYDWMLANKEPLKDIELKHSPPKQIHATEPLTLELSFPPEAKPKQVAVCIRPLDQTRPWRAVALDEMPGHRYAVTIPPNQIDPHFDLQYYFIVFSGNEAVRRPKYDYLEPPYYVVPVEAAK